MMLCISIIILGSRIRNVEFSALCLMLLSINFQVSWIRNSDAHILFIGLDRFVYEDRYELIPSRHGKWTLKLKYVVAQDAGKFECQISTAPKLNQTFTLKVVGRQKVIISQK